MRASCCCCELHFLSVRHAKSTHDSTAFPATKLYSIVKNGNLPSWARIAADDASSSSQHALTPYGGRSLSHRQDAFDFYLSSCRIRVEQAFGMLVSRFGIFSLPCNIQLPAAH